MWTYEHSVETDAAPEAIWPILTDLENWPTWNPDIERIELDGPFRLGAEMQLTPVGQDTVGLRVVELDDGVMFADEAEIPGAAAVRTYHRLDTADSGRTRLTFRMEIAGPAADQIGPELGPMITANYPVVMANLVARANL
jgi:hypothetical protein